jgi:hypothetical protein
MIESYIEEGSQPVNGGIFGKSSLIPAWAGLLQKGLFIT